MLKMEREHIKPVAQMLSRAFKDDLKDIFPDPEERRVKTPFVNEFLIRCSYPYSKAFVTSPKLEGVALWSRSDKRLTKRSFRRILTSGAIWSAIRIGRKALKKMDAFDDYIEKKHSELVPDKHWYLAVLAVDPPHQGKGHASKLIKEMFSNLDSEGLSYYVETEGKKNVSMYKHFGFVVIDEFDIPNTTDHLVVMLRVPKNSTQKT